MTHYSIKVVVDNEYEAGEGARNTYTATTYIRAHMHVVIYETHLTLLQRHPPPHKVGRLASS